MCVTDPPILARFPTKLSPRSVQAALTFRLVAPRLPPWGPAPEVQPMEHLFEEAAPRTGAAVARPRGLVRGPVLDAAGVSVSR